MPTQSLFDFRAYIWDVGYYQLRMSSVYWRAVQLIFVYEVELLETVFVC